MADKTETVTADELAKLRRQGKPSKARHKYGAERTKLDGINFASKLEARYYRLLTTWYDAAAIVGFIRQVPFDLGGGRVHRVDFQVFHVDGTCEFVDVKGRETEGWKLKKALVESRHPWIGEIRPIKKDEIRKLEQMA